MKIQANGIFFNCEVSGKEGAPFAMFSNSLMTDLHMWDEQAEALADDFRVLRYDQRGHGGTVAPPGPYSFALLAADAIALMDALKIEKVNFIGLSMGGMTAVTLAWKYPTRIARIVACDCGPASTPQGAQQWSERIDVARAGGMEALVEPTVARWFPPEFPIAYPARADKIRQMIRTTPLNGFIGCAQALSDFDLKPGLSLVKCPVLFLCGGKDAMLGGTKALHAAIPGSGFVEIEGAGHISNVERPDVFTPAMSAFLRAQG